MLAIWTGRGLIRMFRSNSDDNWNENWEVYTWEKYCDEEDDYLSDGYDYPEDHVNDGFQYNTTIEPVYTDAESYYEEMEWEEEERKKKEYISMLQESCMDSFFYGECDGKCMKCS